MAVIGAMMAVWPSSASAAMPIETGGPVSTTSIISHFYQARAAKPLWFSPTAGDAPQQLLKLLSTSDIDGIDKKRFELGSLLLALREASTGDQRALQQAEYLLSEYFVTYVQELQRDPKVGVIYVDSELKPQPFPVLTLLEAAARSPSLSTYVTDMAWMNPIYPQLRRAHSTLSERQRHQLSINLERARALPPASARYVLVNTANQRLYMYENGRVVDEMKVVAGKTDAQTPLLNAYIRFAVLNPYWNVPADLTARLAPRVVKRGHSYLDKQGYQVVSDFSDNPLVIDAKSVDWDAVATGRLPVQLRQKPGPANSMGRVKFMFPNSQGVWLHDTPSREHFSKDVRLESAGCVRLEDAWRLGSWLLQRPLKPATGTPERRTDLPEPVPVYITYLTAVPNGISVTLIDDVYRRDLLPVDHVNTNARPISTANVLQH
jgi:L,D-transpeptidase YcbB